MLAPSPSNDDDTGGVNPIDAVAAARVLRLPLTRGADGTLHSPWLHEEVARRMADRLGWITRQPASWADWQHQRGGIAGHERVRSTYPTATRHIVQGWDAPVAMPEDSSSRAKTAIKNIANLALRWTRPDRAADAVPVPVDALADGSVQMIWANMLAHQVADVPALLADWHRVLAVDGFLMFSAFGPDTLRELDALYRTQDWPAPHHAFTDMHDWGDRLVAAGFAEPVMDMERITLSFDTPDRLLTELRELGRNLHPARFAGLRGRAWHAQLLQALEALRRPEEDNRLTLTFEIVYGHAFKAAPRQRTNATEQHIDVDTLRQSLHQSLHQSRGQRPAPNA